MSQQSNSPRHNLPRPLTAFVGRKQELRDIVALLENHRLLTLTGSGGVGKTRLGLQVAQDVLFDFEDGVCVVELATVAEPQLVNQTIATAIGVREEAGTPIGLSLLRYLENKSLLLVLDNCEHVIQSVAAISEDILDRCKEVQILVTSRGSLGLSAEKSWRVPSLSMPANRSLNVPLHELHHYDAIRLFLNRAQSLVPGFELTAGNSDAILDICNRLDGIPLALELAAARIPILSPEQIRKRLFDRFVLLRSPSKTALPRHQSLEATLDWSYDLLPDEEKHVFRQLGVFAGGWTLEAAEAITPIGSAMPMFEVMSSLTDKGLVQTKAFHGAVRFEFTETIRQYASEKLKRAGELTTVSDRHLNYFADVAIQAESKLKGSAQQMMLEELAAEDDNLRAALAHGLQADLALVLRMINALNLYWSIRGRWVEAEGWLTRAVTQPVSKEDRVIKARALCTLGGLAYYQGRPEPARKFSEEALEMFREETDEYGVARCLTNLGLTALHTGEHHLAVSLLQQALSIVRGQGNSRAVAQMLNNLAIVARQMGDSQTARNYLELALQITRGLQDQALVALMLNNLGLSYADQNDLPGAERLWVEGLDIFRKLADKRGIASTLHNLADVAFRKGEYDACRRQLLDALTCQYELGQRLSLANTFLDLARLDLAQHQHRKAAVFAGFAVSQRERSGGAWDPVCARKYEQVTTDLEEKLGMASFSDVFGVARSMSIDQAFALARAVESENETQLPSYCSTPANGMERSAFLKAFEHHAPLKKLAAHVEKHPAESLTLQKAADIAGLERTYFSAFFREKTGITFKYWEDLRRIQRAALRLRGSDDSISSIAEESFEDLTTFERTFRRIMGMAPRDYRNTEKPS
jgi:predicted ATPase/AraC-like DNA-binding protein